MLDYVGGGAAEVACEPPSLRHLPIRVHKLKRNTGDKKHSISLTSGMKIRFRNLQTKPGKVSLNYARLTNLRAHGEYYVIRYNT